MPIEPSILEHLANPIDIKVTDLLLDPENPRIIDGLGQDATQSQIVQYLWSEAAVNELVLSISHNGFFPHEPLFAVPVAGKFTVIEGNRRLAALKLILDKSLRSEITQAAFPEISAEIEASLKKIPVVVTTRKDSWRYIGFKHVNGPKQWDSVAKARYIVEVKRMYSVTLQEIAETIGDTNNTVERYFRGMAVLTQAEQLGLFDASDSFSGKMSFSHLYTGLGYHNTKKFLGIEGYRKDDEIVIPSTHYDNLRRYLSWLFGSKTDELEPIVQSQNPYLRNLDKVLGSEAAVETLIATNNLDKATRIAIGEVEILRQKLIKAKSELQDAYGIVGAGLPVDRAAGILIHQIYQLSYNLDGLAQTQLSGKD